VGHPSPFGISRRHRDQRLPVPAETELPDIDVWHGSHVSLLPMKLIDSGLIDDLIHRAETSARRRMHFNLHETLADPIQRLLIASMTDSYIRPHRHPNKWECALVIKGSFDIFLFDDSGRILDRITLDPNQKTVGFEIPANTWHSWIAREDGSVVFELKPGPFDPQTIYEFARWSPEEGSPEVRVFMERQRKGNKEDVLARQ
jgi:cupin fold WbuC family metalloprotein